MQETKRTRLLRRILAVTLTVVMLLSLTVPASAAGKDAGAQENHSPVWLEKVDESEIDSPLHTRREKDEKVEEAALENEKDPDETVRVSIVLDEPSTISAGFSTMNIGQNSQAKAYRQTLRENQTAVQKNIERRVLDGKKLDVVWRLTLAANIISANVKRSDIDGIKLVPGVKDVVEEMQYYPDVVSKGGELEPQMALSGQMTGSTSLWESGYTGAGTKVAIIDTGLDTDHQSFDAGAFEYAIEELKKETGKSYDLLTASQVAGYVNGDQLNISGLGFDPGKLYLNSKVPFAFNYVDVDLDVTHDNDSQGEHGSHVAGIAAANRFVDTNKDGKYEDALKTVKTAGNAPDAQLIVMKVFGKGGGAYDSDYMVAIEDAIVLGANSVNLSLGSSMAGLATSENPYYQQIMDDLANHDTVVTISAGNAGSWAEETYYGYLYSDGVNFSTDGSPGSYGNAFTVASADNNGGLISPTIEVNGEEYGYTESATYGNPALGTLDTTGQGIELPFIMVNAAAAGHDDEVVAVLGKSLSNKIKGKVYITWRGVSSFFVKANAGASVGAAAVIVGNNQAGTISMDLTGYEGSVPVVSITQADAQAIWAAGTPTAISGTDYTYITGTITVKRDAAIVPSDSPLTMSDFSSWGIPSDLSLKPEITAPGGNIYSVNGAGGSDAYELMSGTSMAAPQIAGISAQVQQYLEEENVSVDGLNSRALTQALLMSTAEPIWDATDSDYYYPVFQQGAGHVNVAAAVSTPVVLTVAGQDDGKVKAELGDDPGRDGEYTVTFTLHNMDADSAYEYELSADVFTQDVWNYPEGGYVDYLLDTWAYPLELAEVSFDKGDSVTVPAGDSVTVTATITLNEEEAAYYDDAGFYVEAYIFATPATSVGDGVAVPELSFPVLGYYGSWTDPSMYDVGSYAELYGIVDGDDRIPYVNAKVVESNGKYQLSITPYNYVVDANGYRFYGAESDDPWNSYLSTVSPYGGLAEYDYSLIRNAGNGGLQVSNADTGEVYYRSANDGMEYGAFYYSTAGAWYYTSGAQPIDWEGTKSDNRTLVEDDTLVAISVVRAPEYYADKNGEYDWDVLDDGAFLTTTAIIDNTAPWLVDENGDDLELPAYEDNGDGTYTITIPAKDNNYVAQVEIYPEDGEDYLGTIYPEDDFEDFQDYYDNYKGKAYEIELTVDEASVYLIAVADYAGNYSTYRLFVDVAETADPEDVEEVVIDDGDAVTVLLHNTYQLSAAAYPVYLADRSVTWSVDDESVATVDEFGVVTAVSVGTATVTAASVQNPEVTAECEITVYALEGVLHGILMDEDADTKFFDYDLSDGSITTDLDVNMDLAGVADVNGQTFYLLNNDGEMYLVDKNTGEILSGPTDWSDVTAVSNYSEAAGGVMYVSGGLLLAPDDPAGDAQWSGWNLTTMLGGESFNSIALIDEEWEYGDFVVYALDTANRLWVFLPDLSDGSLYFGTAGGYINTNLTVRPANSYGITNSNLIVNDDDSMFYSVYTGDTNELYYLTYNEGTNSFNASFLGDVGNDVWPALLLSPAEPAPDVPDVPDVPDNPDAPPSIEGNITTEPSENGSVEVDTRNASAGETVTVTTSPDEGYIVGDVTVTDENGNTITVVDNKDGTYTFVMPGSEVTVDAGFITPGTRFKDLDDKAWYRNAVAYAVNHGLMSGTSATTFEPSTATTRGMIVSILYRLEGSPAVNSSTTFSDVPANQWYAKAVAWGNDNKIVSGYGNGKFGPNDPVTREQMASILYRYARYKGYDLSGQADLSDYTDAGKIGSWALEAMKWANDANLITGRTDTTLVPGGKATRVESASILMRYCRNVAGMD